MSEEIEELRKELRKELDHVKDLLNLKRELRVAVRERKLLAQVEELKEEVLALRQEVAALKEGQEALPPYTIIPNPPRPYVPPSAPTTVPSGPSVPLDRWYTTDGWYVTDSTTTGQLTVTTSGCTCGEEEACSNCGNTFSYAPIDLMASTNLTVDDFGV